MLRPQFDTSIPGIRTMEAVKCQACLYDLIEYHRDFDSALKLYKYCKWIKANQNITTDLFGEWKKIAGRDGAISIYNFVKGINGAKFWGYRCEAIKKRMSSSIFKEVHARLSQDFPDTVIMRHAVAHLADVMQNKDWFEKNVFEGEVPEDMGMQATTKDGGYMMVSNTFVDDRFTGTYMKRFCSYELSDKTNMALLDIMGLFLSAFSPLYIA